MEKIPASRKLEILRMQHEFDLESVLKAIDTVSSRMRDYADQIDRVRDRFKAEPNPESVCRTRRDILPEVVNTIENLMRNFDFATLTRRIAQFTASELAVELSE